MALFMAKTLLTTVDMVSQKLCLKISTGVKTKLQTRYSIDFSKNQVEFVWDGGILIHINLLNIQNKMEKTPA